MAEVIEPNAALDMQAEETGKVSTADKHTTFQRFRRSIWGRWSVRLLFYIVLIGAWQLVFSTGIWPDYEIPGPLEVVNSLVTGFGSGLYLQSLLVTLGRLGIGYGISLIIGVVLGLLMGRVNLIKDTIGSLVLGLQALPSVCWLPMAILWFGLDEQAVIFVVIMGALFSITLGVEAGVRNTQPIYLKAARNMGARGFGLYSQVILPAALPAVLSGLKQGWTFAWRSLMAAELIYLTVSLGNLLDTGRNLLDSSMVISVMLLIIAVSVAIDTIVFSPLERFARTRWGLAD
jgi:NitT/TauT family transport system permease protein